MDLTPTAAHATCQYAFNQLEAQLAISITHMHSMDDLKREIYAAWANISGIDGTFAHCGYPV